MKLYLAGATKRDFPLVQKIALSSQVQPSLLLSYYVWAKTDLQQVIQQVFSCDLPDIFLDSGGFSAMTQGVALDIREYCEYIKRYRHLITTYANLDIIGDAQQTWIHQQYMEDQGLSPLPVFHVGEPWSYLDRYLERYSCIALGGLVPYTRTPRRVLPWLLTCFRMAHGIAVYHGFGCTSWVMMSQFPWYSVDSSAWQEGKRFRHASVFQEQRGKFQELFFGDSRSCYTLAPVLRRMGLNPEAFLDRNPSLDEMNALGAQSYWNAARWITRRYGEIAIPQRKGGVHA